MSKQFAAFSVFRENVHLAKDDLLGFYPWKGRLDPLNIVLIGISNELPEHDEKYELHCLLSTLLSAELTVDEKLGIIRTGYSIPVDDKLRKDMNAMCNLSQGIRDAENVKIIMNMYRKGYTLEQITECVEKTIEEVETVIKKRESVLA